MIYHQQDAVRVSKSGVDMWIYATPPETADIALVYQETKTGHAEEFRHTKSAFVYFIIEGAGEWVIEGEAYPVQASDVVVIPAGKQFYFRGALKQICVTAPAWEHSFEEHIRSVDL
jgi:mannose-6-phosphate isomerase-like protein (cupin superfamily)